MFAKFGLLVRTFFSSILGFFFRKNAIEVRKQVVEDQAAKVREGKDQLGAVRGNVRRLAGQIKSEEADYRTINTRKQHYMKLFQEGDESAKDQALEQHHRLAAISTNLETLRSQHEAAEAQYEKLQALIQGATAEVAEEKAKTRQLARAKKNAEATAALTGVVSDLSGIGNGLSQLDDVDDELNDQINTLQGQADVNADFADAANADRKADAAIAKAASNDAFEAELAAMGSKDVKQG